MIRMFFTKALFIVLCCVHQSVQIGVVTQMTSASYKEIEVEEDSWMVASWNEAKTFLTNSTKGISKLMCASLCTTDELCNAYIYNETSGCFLGNATPLVGVSSLSVDKSTIFVYINAALVPVNGTLGGWGGKVYSGHSDRYHALCSNESVCQSRECSAPMNGGMPCKELIENNLPGRCFDGSPYRCHYVELGLGGRQSSATNPRILMARCKGENCQDVNVQVAAKVGSPYILYREYTVLERVEHKMAPITTNCNDMDSHYKCNSTNCTFTGVGGGEGALKDKGHIFIFICGEHEGGILQATGGNLVSITQYCATVFNCTDPVNCWVEDIKAHVYNQALTGVKAVSIMPGCTLIFSITGFDVRTINMNDINEPATDTKPVNWRILQEEFPDKMNADDDGKVMSCGC